MDRRQMGADMMEAMLAVMQSVKSDLWTAMPGIVVSVDLGARTANIKPAIQAMRRPAQRVEGEEPYEPEWVDMPDLLDCPIVMPQGGNYVISLPVAPGDSVLVVFASRCIDGWFESGGVAQQLDLRMHSLSDGFCIPGVVPKGAGGITEDVEGVLSGPTPLSADALEIRSKDGLQSVKLGAESIAVTHPVLITLAAPLILANGTPIP